MQCPQCGKPESEWTSSEGAPCCSTKCLEAKCAIATRDERLAKLLESGIARSPEDANAMIVHSVALRAILQARDSWPDSLGSLTDMQVLEGISLLLNSVAMGSGVGLSAILGLVSQDFKATRGAHNGPQA